MDIGTTLIEEVGSYLAQNPNPKIGEELAPGVFLTWEGNSTENFWKHMEEVNEN